MLGSKASRDGLLAHTPPPPPRLQHGHQDLSIMLQSPSPRACCPRGSRHYCGEDQSETVGFPWSSMQHPPLPPPPTSTLLSLTMAFARDTYYQIMLIELLHRSCRGRRDCYSAAPSTSTTRPRRGIGSCPSHSSEAATTAQHKAARLILRALRQTRAACMTAP